MSDVMGPKPPPSPTDLACLRLLRYGALVRDHGRGLWRFGTRRFQDVVVDRLLASGRVVRSGDRVRLAAVASIDDIRTASGRRASDETAL
jgi:hypothetical protein